MSALTSLFGALSGSFLEKTAKRLKCVRHLHIQIVVQMLRFRCLNKAVLWGSGLPPRFLGCSENLTFTYSVEAEELSPEIRERCACQP